MNHFVILSITSGHLKWWTKCQLVGDLTKIQKNPENQWKSRAKTRVFNSYENPGPTSWNIYNRGAVFFLYWTIYDLGGKSITQILHSPSLTWKPSRNLLFVSRVRLGGFCLNFRCHGSAAKSTKAKAVYICKTDLYFFSIASNIRFKMMKPKNTSWVLLYFLCLSHVYRLICILNGKKLGVKVSIVLGQKDQQLQWLYICVKDHSVGLIKAMPITGSSVSFWQKVTSQRLSSCAFDDRCPVTWKRKTYILPAEKKHLTAKWSSKDASQGEVTHGNDAVLHQFLVHLSLI